jgi:hypothetical protein
MKVSPSSLTLALTVSTCLASTTHVLAINQQIPFSVHHTSEDPSDWTELPDIKRVAVIGAGPSGLVSASTLIEHGFEVRLFDRQPGPGGNWLYSPVTALPAPFPFVTFDITRFSLPVD